MKRLSRTTSVLFLAFIVAQVSAQEVDTRSLESGYARVVSFEAQPEISAARFSVDSDDPAISGLDIDTAKLPFYREFDSDEVNWRWFIQATGSYLSMESTIELDLSSQLEHANLEWRGIGGLVEGGLIFSLSDNLDLAPSVGLGVTGLENEMEFSSRDVEDALAPQLDGVLYNWDTLASVVRTSVALRYDQKFENWRVKARAHLSGSYIDSFEESDRFPGFTDEAANLGMKVDVSHSIGIEIRDYPVFAIGHLGFTQFIGANRNELGFGKFGEVGLSLGVQKLTLGMLGIFGDDVSGWNLLFNYDY